MITIKNFPLRERNKARTRLSIIDAFLVRLENKNFDDITIDEICDDVQISKGTFFNYFPRKIDMILYNALLWNLEAMWLTTKRPGASPGLPSIDYIFAWFAETIKKHPLFFLELIALRSRKPEEINKLDEPGSRRVSSAERVLRFPELQEITSIKAGNYSHILRIQLEAAIKKEELPDNIDIEAVILSLGIILYGVPLMLINQNPEKLAKTYLYHLNLFWAGLKTTVQ